MKNLPENNFWNEIKDRLDHYAEEPADDSWDKIAGALNNTPRPRVLAWLERRASSAQVGLTGFALLVALMAGDQPATTWSGFVANAEQEEVYSDKEHATSSDNTTALTVPKEAATSQQEQSISRKEKSARARTVSQKAKTYTRFDETVSAETPATKVIAQDTTASGDETLAKNRMVSPAGLSAVDTVAQVDIDKKEKKVVVNASTKKEAEKKKAQLHIPMVFFQAGPSLAYHKITPSTNDDVTITELEESGVFASDRVGFSLEAGFQYRVAPRLEVYGGLSYYQQQQHIRYTLAHGASGSVAGNPDDGYVFTPVTSQQEVKYTLRNAGVSAGVFYRVKTHLLEHKLGVGLLYQQGFQSTAGEGSAYTNKGSKYLQYQLLYRMEAGLNDHMRLYFQPGYTHAFHVDEKLNAPFTIKPYRAGISVGIVYLFNK
ncbi:hypothetical protein KK062_12660 [Fulvivirgaceae bacterium PWU5]|uniref:Outer membrane protein beta-barrel domain-containing protein n=1 Tax=Dawidia cretensis TaxID=2782350 RepID=A0AAP2DWW3_9BACT|nr:hypothetical protein [Dawidia cretensis]MBT1709085.1 hypothetical protein [Dawidia cretensis]